GHLRGGFGPARFFDALSAREIGEGALKFLHAIEDDAAIDIGGGEFRIELDRMIEVVDRTVQVAVSIGENAMPAIRARAAGRRREVERRAQIWRGGGAPILFEG